MCRVKRGSSAPALETLAVIAYRQPVLRSAIEAIRGVNCGEVLRQLMGSRLGADWLAERRAGPAVFVCYDKAVLELFGLNTIDELPRGQELPLGPLPMARTLCQRAERQRQAPGLSAKGPSLTRRATNLLLTDREFSRRSLDVKVFTPVGLLRKMQLETDWDGRRLSPRPRNARGVGRLAAPRLEEEEDDFEEEEADDEEDDWEDDEEEELEDEEDEARRRGDLDDDDTRRRMGRGRRRRRARRGRRPRRRR